MPRNRTAFAWAITLGTSTCLVTGIGTSATAAPSMVPSVQAAMASTAPAARKARTAAQRRAAKRRAAARRKAARKRQASKKPPAPTPAPTPAPLDTYTFDGSGNNVSNPAWGATGTELLRLTQPGYADGVSAMAGSDRRSPRVISNQLSAQEESLPSERDLSGYVYVFGQFLDHDLSLTFSGAESSPIAVPVGDQFFDPHSLGNRTISFTRSQPSLGSGTSTSNPREHTNTISTYIDGSQIYGSDEVRARALRTMSGGKLKTSDGRMLPRNTDGLPNFGGGNGIPDSELFVAGDLRANENADLTAIHTLFVREHNRIAENLAKSSPNLTDEQLYQRARQTVIAELQAITYNEFLPALLGDQLPSYRGYRSDVNPTIATEFSTAAFRFGHSTLDPVVGRMNNNGTTVPQGNLSLRDAFFNPRVFDVSLPNNEGDIDPLLKANATENSQEVDLKVIDDVRNFLFGPPGAGGFDLVSLNIQRGRDHGLADYNSTRAAYGLKPVSRFDQISSDVETQRALERAYTSVDNIDLWVGGLAEDHVAGSSFGPLFATIIADQFARLRDGDRYYYENVMTGSARDNATSTTLSQVIRRNTALTTVQSNVFRWRDRS